MWLKCYWRKYCGGSENINIGSFPHLQLETILRHHKCLQKLLDLLGTNPVETGVKCRTRIMETRFGCVLHEKLAIKMNTNGLSKWQSWHSGTWAKRSKLAHSRGYSGQFKKILSKLESRKFFCPPSGISTRFQKIGLFEIYVIYLEFEHFIIIIWWKAKSRKLIL